MENSWQIIKEELTKNSRPDTMGRCIDLNKCGNLFVKLMYNLKDQEKATKSMNEDGEMKMALLNQKGINELREAGVLSK